MDKARLLELMAYASVCFDKLTSPFALTHLRKKNVTADECGNLSFEIAEILKEELELRYKDEDVKEAFKKALEEFEETQKEL